MEKKEMVKKAENTAKNVGTKVGLVGLKVVNTASKIAMAPIGGAAIIVNGLDTLTTAGIDKLDKNVKVL